VLEQRIEHNLVGGAMWKKLCLALGVAAATGLTACIAVPVEEDHYHHRHYRSYDHDRDGIYDRADRDRDGDGVPNWRDRRPDNPRRW
jgi:hypothetical protein